MRRQYGNIYIQLDELTYEILSDALTAYSEEISDVEEKKEILYTIIGYLCNINCLSSDNYDILITNVTKDA